MVNYFFQMVSAFTNGPAIVDPRVGGQFELFGGNISGEFTELVCTDPEDTSVHI